MLIFDATPLIYLAKSYGVKLLTELDEELVIPQKVFKEVVEKGLENDEPDARKIQILVDEDVFEVRNCELEGFLERNSNLSLADKQVLKIADETGSAAVMDEAYGRRIAESEDIETRGTAYIVLKLQKLDILTDEESKELIDELVDQGWYCSTSLYKDILNKIEEIN